MSKTANFAIRRSPFRQYLSERVSLLSPREIPKYFCSSLSFTRRTGYLHLRHIMPGTEGLAMACGIIVQLPATGAFGSDEDFDLRTQLERELGTALALAQAGECGRGEIEAGRINVCLESITNPASALQIVKDVLTRLKLLHRAIIVQETRCENDPDDIDRQTLWPLHHSTPARVA